MSAEYEDFLKIDIRVGTIVEVEKFPQARTPAFKVFVDFGKKIGIKKSSAQLTENYDESSLMGLQVAAVVNFPPKQIGPLMSEFLILGFPDKDGNVVLVMPEKSIPNGGALY